MLKIADLDYAKIALLPEAKAVYPDLWKVLDRFSVYFQTWRSETSEEMLFSLQIESASSVTP